MANAGLPWVQLTASAERRRWLQAAALLCVVLAAACGARALTAATVALLATAAAALGGAALAWRSGRQARPAGALRVDAEGRFWLRPAGAGDEAAAAVRPCFVAARFVALDGAAGALLVWRDSLPAVAFRRLCAHARWQLDRGAAKATDAAADHSRI